MNELKIPKVRLQWFGSPAHGRRLELLAADEDGQAMPNLSSPIATIFEDEETEQLVFEIYTGRHAVQVSLADIQQAMETAVRDVSPGIGNKARARVEEQGA